MDPLRAFWDFADLDATERRFRDHLQDASLEERANVLTQVARVAGLRGDFDTANQLIDEAEELAGTSARSQLERGRLRRSSGDADAALPLFESAFERAAAAGEDFLAADAAHMAALAAPDRDARLNWTERGVAFAEDPAHPAAAYWLGPLLNNVGWDHYEAGEYERALDAFERALRARERDPERPAEIAIARYAVAKTLRALGRLDEATSVLEQAIAWTDSAGEPDGWFHEELAETYDAAGRRDEARAQARLALPLLEGADPSFAGERAERLRGLAAA